MIGGGNGVVGVEIVRLHRTPSGRNGDSWRGKAQPIAHATSLGSTVTTGGLHLIRTF
ncbi:hypothetical protein RB862 [Rhodopirellula baltica SH 1]|uniref:Uncharacterized protein n=1 Tax=Rhodopirellula baltica (strain DSM 10527 / NCIMB 13988 / SH1) TaxID=243090 RepID=Q7UY59_RHOBA|nr:hypothetical protein RB862 [Rhodopirellula baltica SH 1]